MNRNTVTVFGGTGFLGRRVVRHLRGHGFSVRIASRHPDTRVVSSIEGPPGALILFQLADAAMLPAISPHLGARTSEQWGAA